MFRMSLEASVQLFSWKVNSASAELSMIRLVVLQSLTQVLNKEQNKSTLPSIWTEQLLKLLPWTEPDRSHVQRLSTQKSALLRAWRLGKHIQSREPFSKSLWLRKNVQWTTLHTLIYAFSESAMLSFNTYHLKLQSLMHDQVPFTTIYTRTGSCAYWN